MVKHVVSAKHKTPSSIFILYEYRYGCGHGYGVTIFYTEHTHWTREYGHSSVPKPTFSPLKELCCLGATKIVMRAKPDQPPPVEPPLENYLIWSTPILPERDYAILYRSHPPGWNFRQFFFATLYLSHPLTCVQNFTEIVSQRNHSIVKR